MSSPPFGSVEVAPGTIPPLGSGPGMAPIPVESVAMVGDSITVRAQAELELGLAALGLDDVEIDAVSGRRLAYVVYVNNVKPIESIADVIGVFADEGVISALLFGRY